MMVMSLVALLAVADPLPVFDDTQLLVQATTYLQAGEPGDPRESVLGTHKGKRVIGVMFPGTPPIRVIHYDVKPGKPCLAAGGVAAQIALPHRDIGDLMLTYCVPQALYRAHRYAYSNRWL